MPTNILADLIGSITADPAALGQYMGNYRFPTDLASGPGRNFYVDIQFQKYERRSIFDQPFLRANGGIQLPIPTNLIETTMARWKPESAPLVGAAIENYLYKAGNVNGIGAGIDLAAETGTLLGVSGLPAIVKGVLGAVGERAGLGNTLGEFASQLGSVTNQALQLAGKAQNPFLTQLFDQPSFRTHSFSWVLAPRNAQESETVKQIILAFKANMLPAMSPGSGGILLTYPNMAAITFYPAPDFLYKLKPCVVTEFRVDYTGGGMPSFFRGTNAPTIVKISVNLLEIEYFLREDIVDPSMRSLGAVTPITFAQSIVP